MHFAQFAHLVHIHHIGNRERTQARESAFKQLFHEYSLFHIVVCAVSLMSRERQIHEATDCRPQNWAAYFFVFENLEYCSAAFLRLGRLDLK